MDEPSGESYLQRTKSGKFFLQVEKDGNDTPYYVSWEQPNQMVHNTSVKKWEDLIAL